MTQDREYHRPVMADETVELLGPVPPGVVIDATFGGGGHSRRLLEVLSSDHRVLGIDRDPEAVARASHEGGRLQVIRGNFANLARILDEANVTAPVGVLFDFGVSSHHLDDPARGFSYRHGGPLDMRMDPDQDLTASDLVNGLEVSELSALIRELGEEPMASRIAAAIVKARPIADTARLAEVIASAVPPSRTRETGRRRLHPARRTFQALRIAVNSELEAVESGVDQALEILAPEGRVVAISYHSLEDRIVKRRFVTAVSGCVCPPDLPICGCGASPKYRSLTRGAVKPSQAEAVANPRARSARLRGLVRVAA
ncbi:MAG: 16S rRNA (cytosine(1402)-N(4))-methyltransferase RsmH [Acidimicrobiia bacterium]